MAVLNLRAIICIIALTMEIYIHGNETAVVISKINHYTGHGILAGIGYSEDMQQMTAERCYNAIKISTSEQQSFVKLSQASSSSELERELGISVSLSGSYGEFSAEAKAHYLRSFQDNDYAISLNYYEYNSNQISIQLAGPGDKALTDSGKSFYDNGKNLYFGLTCGDYYISSYQQGALLTMGLYIKFSSSAAKAEFEEEAGVSFGSIISASESIKNATSKRQLTGLIIIQAYQVGGEPNKLSKIFNKNSTGDYYALTCSLTAMDDCTKAASGLLDYATSNFPEQFSFEKNIGLTPLGIAFSEYQPIEWIGLAPSVSLVTDEVKQYRIELSMKLRENKYYEQKIHPFVNNGYPVELVESFIRDTNSLLLKVNHNLLILMQSHGGAIDCYNYPDECNNTKASIDSQLKDITISDLTFLNNIKYTLTMMDLIWYNTGVTTETSWGIVFIQPDQNHVTVQRVSVTSKHFEFDLKSTKCNWERQYRGVAENNLTYAGYDYQTDRIPRMYMRAHKVVSEYFFELYNINADDTIKDPDPSMHQVQNKKKIRFSIVFDSSKNGTM